MSRAPSSVSDDLDGDEAPATAVERWLDRMAAPGAPAVGREVAPYLAFGVTGMAAGFALLSALALERSVPFVWALVLSVAAVATFVLAGLARKAILGEERHVLLEDVLLVLGVGGALSWWLGQPVGTTLDLLACALGIFLCFGRVGCFRSGCCHGRPSTFGARYGGDGPLRGLRLFPLQLLEGLWLLAVTAVSVAAVVRQATPGAAAWGWLLAYAAGRFVLELARGDAGRPRWGPLFEAQWLFVALVVARVAWEHHALALPPRLAVAAGAALALVVLAWLTRARWLALPPPLLTVDDVARAQPLLVELERAARTSSQAAMLVDALEIRLVVDRGDGGVEVQAYALRRTDGPLDEAQALAWAGLIAQRLAAPRPLRADGCDHGSFHLWLTVDAAGVPASTADDLPFAVLLRAQAFARRVQRWSHLPAAAPAMVVDPALLPPPEPARVATVAAARAPDYAAARTPDQAAAHTPNYFAPPPRR